MKLNRSHVTLALLLFCAGLLTANLVSHTGIATRGRRNTRRADHSQSGSTIQLVHQDRQGIRAFRRADRQHDSGKAGNTQFFFNGQPSNGENPFGDMNPFGNMIRRTCRSSRAAHRAWAPALSWTTTATS
jgi:hypothetical protein